MAHLDVNPNNALVAGLDAQQLHTVLIDFGNSCVESGVTKDLVDLVREEIEELGPGFDDVTVNTILRCGPRSTPLYIDPLIAREVWPDDARGRFKYAKQVDIFAAGMTILELALGSTLFKLNKQKKITLPEQFGQIFFTPGKDIIDMVPRDSPLKPIAEAMLRDFKDRLKKGETMDTYIKKLAEEKQRLDAIIKKKSRE